MTGRVLRLTGTQPASVPSGRVLRITGTGTLPAATPHGRVLRITGTGVAAVIVTAPAPRTIGPGQSTTLTASLADGGADDSWTWRQRSGPAVTLVGTGASRTLVGPSVMPPSSQGIVVEVTATRAGVVSSTVTVTITVLPQIRWYRLGSPTWRGAIAAPA